MEDAQDGPMWRYLGVVYSSSERLSTATILMMMRKSGDLMSPSSFKEIKTLKDFMPRTHSGIGGSNQILNGASVL